MNFKVKGGSIEPLETTTQIRPWYSGLSLHQISWNQNLQFEITVDVDTCNMSWKVNVKKLKQNQTNIIKN